MIKGILLDVDGTLIDSNDAHASAWVDAFSEYGHKVDFMAVRKLIGMGGDKLIATIQPNLSDDKGDGKKIKEKRSKIFLDKYASQLKPTNGSRILVKTLQKRNLKTIVASSAKSDELEVLLKAAKVSDLLEEATTSDDAENSKPEPDIIQVALEKIGLTSDEVLMIGDTPYDIEAARKAGVACIAVRSGGWDDEDLKDAVAVFDNAGELADNLEMFVKR